MTPSLDTGCRIGGVTVSLVSEHPGFGSDPPIGSSRIRGAPVSGIRASRIRFGPANRVGSKNGPYSSTIISSRNSCHSIRLEDMEHKPRQGGFRGCPIMDQSSIVMVGLLGSDRKSATILQTLHNHSVSDFPQAHGSHK